MPEIKSNIYRVKTMISDAARVCGRDPEGIRLLAVSKTFPAQDIRLAFEAGQQAFGENYVDEALDKIHALADLDIEWHFIGPIQSNKTRKIAENFSWVHGLCSEKTAKRLNAQRPADLPPLNVCIQVNISGESNKSGITPTQMMPLAEFVKTLPRLNLRGIMGIPEMTTDENMQRERFHELSDIFKKLKMSDPGVDTLSMGMTADMTQAIAQGSTMVRIGTAIFGQRTNKTAHINHE